MVTKSDTYFIVSVLLILLAGLGQQDTTSCSDRVEVCLPSESPFHCSCSSPSNTQCFWISFADPDKRLSDVTSEPILMWNVSTGYGQYMCVRADNLTAEHHQNVSRTILILPEAQRRSCDGCISTRICRATTGKYLLQFTKLFDQSLLAGDCGLHFTNHLLPNGTLTEEMCVELLPNFNYSILCPICYPNTRDIHYEIPIFNIENCSSSDICSSQSATTTATSTMTTSTSTATTTTHITMATISTTFAVTTMNMSDVSSGDDENTVGIIIGVVGGLVAIIIVSIIIFAVLLYRHHSKKEKISGNKNMSATNEVALSASSSDIRTPMIHVPDNSANNTSSGMHTLDTITVNEASNIITTRIDQNLMDQPSMGQPMEGQALIQQSKITGDHEDYDSSSTETKLSQLLACNRSQLIDAITELHVIIKQHIKIETLIPLFHKYRIFTPDEIDDFMNKFYSNADKVSYLISWLQKKDENGIHNFMRALNEEWEHSGHLVILEHLHKKCFL